MGDVEFGTGTKILSGDVTMSGICPGAHEGELNITAPCDAALYAVYTFLAQQATWVHGIKVELTRGADIQVAGTGAWFGGQFVLNQGSAGYATPTHKVHAIQAIVKGSDGRTDVDGNVARFETQSDGKVGCILYLTANLGSTIGDQMQYIASHVNVNKGIELNGATGTMGSAIATVGTITNVIYCASTTTNFAKASASGKGGITVGAMVKDPQSDPTVGYITIDVGGTSYQIPFYATA